MPWNADGKRWDCELCSQTVQGRGPWCDLYGQERREICRPMAKYVLNAADARGDGPLVNAICAYGRARWGEDLDW